MNLSKCMGYWIFEGRIVFSVSICSQSMYLDQPFLLFLTLCDFFCLCQLHYMNRTSRFVVHIFMVSFKFSEESKQLFIVFQDLPEETQYFAMLYLPFFQHCTLKAVYKFANIHLKIYNAIVFFLHKRLLRIVNTG